MHEVGSVGKLMRALGLMSGTSMDGIDIALVDTDGENEVARGPTSTVAYDPAQRRAIGTALAEAKACENRAQRVGSMAETERLLTDWHTLAITEFLGRQEIDPRSIDIVGFHGQTVLHRPEAGLTIQLGDGQRLARQLGLPVIFDLRADDVAAGGQGAPLAPVYHRALVARITDRPVAVLNVGGVGNVTWIGPAGEIIAFDTGPGNALIDDWMMQRAGLARDQDGVAAGQGRINEDVLRFLLSHPFFALPPPKSLDRNDFVWDAVEWMSIDDGAATLTAFTAASIARAREHFPSEPLVWVVCGGGRKNRTLMSMLAGRVENAVVPAETIGFDGDSVEAEAWAYMAVRSLKGLPITFPGTTGAPRPLNGGVLARPDE